MKISPHQHCESKLTGSTISALVKRAKELGRTHFSYTDNGSLSSCLKAYKEAEKEGLKFAAGIEFYFKDSFCPVTSGTGAARCKYFTGTIFTTTQAAYQQLCRLVSREDLPTTLILEEKQQLWGWSQLEELSKLETLLVLGGPHCMVGKVLLADGEEVAEKVFNKLRDLYGDRLYVSLICSGWGKKYATVVEFNYKDETRDALLSTDIVSTNKAKKIKAIDVINRPGHTHITSKIVASTHFEVGKDIAQTKVHKGFLPLPGGDVDLRINAFLLAMAKKYSVMAIVTDYAYYATKPDKIVQTMVLGGSDKLYADLHMREDQEFFDYLTKKMLLSYDETAQIIANNDAFADKFNDFKLKYEWRLADVGPDPLKQCMEIIQKIGRMKWDDPVYVARLREEITVIAKNPKKDMSGYFLPICDVINKCIEEGGLPGPSRGSVAGSLFCYLLGITQIDPIHYGLSFPRFLSLDRLANGDIPDVDTDFPDRTFLVGEDGKSGYLYGRWGDKAAQISTRHTVRLKSAIKDTNRYLNGEVEDDIEKFSKALPEPPQGVSDAKFIFGYEDTDGNREEGLIEKYQPLQDYIKNCPQEWDIVQKAIGITRAHSQHASAFVLSDVPIKDVIPVRDGHITQYDAKACEAAGLIKYDFLVVQNLKDIQVCLKLINEKNKEKHKIGYFTHKGKTEYIWDLPNDPDAFKSIWNGSTETLFQINTKSMIPFVREILPESVEDLSTILALVRPGPMDYINQDTGRTMAEEYVFRRQGKSQPDLKELFELIPETHAVIVFQEQSLEISKKLGGMLPSDAEKLRRIFSKKEKDKALAMKPLFMSTAVPKIGEEKANKIWDMMETSSRYSFNKSHSVAYALISYAGIFLKYHYPLEWWAAILTNAKEKEISGKLWVYVKDIVAPPDINLSTDAMVVDYANKKIRAKFGVIRGMGDKSIDPIVEGRPYKDIEDFVNKGVAGPSLSRKLIYVGVLDSLFPAGTTFLDKMQAYEDALELKAYKKKLKIAQENGKGIRATEPKKGIIPQEYIELSKETNAMKDAARKKSILPSLSVGLHYLGTYYSKTIADYRAKPCQIVESPSGHSNLLLSGEDLERLDEYDTTNQTEDKYVAAIGYVIDMSEFDYANNTRQALKLSIDFDGYICEKVIWPHFQTKELTYPKELKKGCIATFFLKKKAGVEELKYRPTSIMSVVVET